MLNNNTDPFEARGLSIEKAAELGASHRSGKFVFEYRNASGELLSRKIRTQDKDFWFEPKGVPLVLWGIDRLRDLGSSVNEPLVFTEGEFDAIAVAQCAPVHVVSVPNGADGKVSHGTIVQKHDTGFRYLWGEDYRLLPEIAQFKKIILAVDNDERGEILRDELAVRLGRSRCWFVTYPDGCKDANDVLKKHGAKVLGRVIGDAMPMEPSYLITPDQIPPYRETATYSTGWPFLDKHIKIVRPELFVITGVPGAGKSQFARALTFHLAEKHGWRIGYLTPEDPIHRLKRDMVRFANRNGRRYQDEAWINKHFYISQVPEDVTLTMDVVWSEMEKAAFQHDCQAYLLDPWNEVFHDYGRLTEGQYIERTIMQTKRKIRELNMVKFIVAHPRKIEEGKKPTLYDISGSASWKNKPDHGVIIHRGNSTSSVVSVITERTKDHETMGRPGELQMRFRPSACDYDYFEPPAAPPISKAAKNKHENLEEANIEF
jgi:twinkle protein